MKTYAYGFPRLGVDRRYKKHIEDFWNNRIKEDVLTSLLGNIEKERLSIYKKYIDIYPLNEFTNYDHILDAAFMFGVYKFKNLEDYYQYARGKKALAMKKYFNTNYHYLVPRIEKNSRFLLKWNKPAEYLNKFNHIKDKPVFCMGPFTLLKLSDMNRNFERAFNELSGEYEKLFKVLKAKGVESIHLEEPAFVLDSPSSQINLIRKIYKRILEDSPKVNLITYYESVSFLNKLYDLNFNAIALDFVAGNDSIKLIKKYGFPTDKNLICGIVDGKNPALSNVFDKARQIESIKKITNIDYSNICISNSCPLSHLPVTVENEREMDNSVKKNLSFAKEKLHELSLIKDVLSGRSKGVKHGYSCISSEYFIKKEKRFKTETRSKKEFLLRQRLHREKLKLPLLPTTTIGSFPQDRALRKMRLDYIKGTVNKKTYDDFIKNKIKSLIQFQEEVGLDVLVHGEFERTDMVEFFAQKLDGFVTTKKGWVISYGTRVYRPPIIYDKIKRVGPVTLKEIIYAQSLTKKPVKGIFTGPITILAWSYHLRKQPLYETAFEIARALNQEARALILKGIPIIQIDEPAIREFAPIKDAKKSYYYNWAIKAFNMTAKLPQKTQVHTHLCYSEFGEIINWILKMNFDVITIESAREDAGIVDIFNDKGFKRQIGPGVWDIHSKAPADKAKIRMLLNKMDRLLNKEQIWLNPDCGLKTRDWPETAISLKRIVETAKEYRQIDF